MPRDQVIALPSKKGLSTAPREQGLRNDRPVEPGLADLLIEPTNGKSPRDIHRRLTRGWITSKIKTPSVEVSGQLTEQPIATMV